MSQEDGRFAGIPDPNRMDYFDPNVDLNEVKPGRIMETIDGNSVRNHSEALGESNVKLTPMSPGREYSIEASMKEQEQAWNTRFE